MKAILLAVSCFLTLPLIAQDSSTRPNRPRIVEPPQSGFAPPVMPQPTVRRDTAPAPQQPAELTHNITIRLQGTTTNGDEIDLSLSGIGPSFNADQAIDKDTTLSCEYLVAETETGYKVTYRVSKRIKIATENSAGTTKYEFMDVTLSNTVLCAEGRPLVLVLNGGKALKLTITKEAE
jgi:uncharacterized membrane protein